ncbi:MAG: hypothetical protein ACP5HM_06185 [Anaerolineae bacterium]
MPSFQIATFEEAYTWPPWWAVRFALAHPPAPGRFVLADLGGPLREVLFPSALDDEGFTALVPPGHPATGLIPGAEVDVLGPLGRGFDLGAARRLLLVAEVAYLPPLLPLQHRAPAVALVLEAPTRAQLPPTRRFPPAVELHLLTRDGTAGTQGTLEAEGDDAPLRRLLRWADGACFACAPERYPALARFVETVRLRPGDDFAQALMRVPMPCGVGACEVCRVQTRRGERRACVDGPVFNLLDLGA